MPLGQHEPSIESASEHGVARIVGSHTIRQSDVHALPGRSQSSPGSITWLPHVPSVIDSAVVHPTQVIATTNANRIKLVMVAFLRMDPRCRACRADRWSAISFRPVSPRDAA